MPAAGRAPPLPPGVADVLSVLRSAAVVARRGRRGRQGQLGRVRLGLVRGSELVHAELLAAGPRRSAATARSARSSSSCPRAGRRRRRLVVRARVAPLGSHHVLLLVEDLTEARRVEAVRRDFVANVSHELKTPVGALSLLAEAVMDASDDPEAVDRFAARMQVEADRLTSLVKEIIDLSRLQDADPLHEPGRSTSTAWSPRPSTAAALAADGQADRASPPACDPEPARSTATRTCWSPPSRNLVENAVNYSEPGTRVAVGGRRAGGDLVEIAVTDQGIGIPEAEQDRIFERFYRVDAARSRATGGTGLGLAIVKHICANHGGDVTVWSEEGRARRSPCGCPPCRRDRIRPTTRAPADRRPVDAPLPSRPAARRTLA